MKVLIYWTTREHINEAVALLTQEGHQAVTVNSFSQLQQQLHTFCPDVILCHCHVVETPRAGFKQIHDFTRQARVTLPGCIIIITYRISIDRRCSPSPYFGRQDHSYIFDMLGDDFQSYDKDFMYYEGFLTTEHVRSLDRLSGMIRDGLMA